MLLPIHTGFTEGKGPVSSAGPFLFLSFSLPKIQKNHLADTPYSVVHGYTYSVNDDDDLDVDTSLPDKAKMNQNNTKECELHSGPAQKVSTDYVWS